MSRFLDTVVAYRILRMLATPIEQSDAYRMGIIDKNGDKLKDPEGPNELDAYSLLQRFVFKVQKALTKSPDRQAKRLLTFAAALSILREQSENVSEDELDTLLDLYMEDEIVKQQSELLEKNLLSFKNFQMDEMMGVGSGAIAGLGVGPQGEPGRSAVFMPLQRRKRKRKKDARKS